MSPTPTVTPEAPPTPTPDPAVTPPLVGEQDDDSPVSPTGRWTEAILALVILALAFGFGAMLYRQRNRRDSDDDEEPDDDQSAPDEPTDEPPEEHDDDVPPSEEDDRYDVLRYDPPPKR